MSLITIVLNVDCDTSLTDPHVVADELGMDSSEEIFGIEINGVFTEVNFVSAEWNS